MTERPSMTSLLDTARKMREMDDEFIPMIIYTPKSGEPGCIAALAGDGPIADMLVPALSQIRKQFGSAEWIALTSDTWAKTYPKPEGDGPVEFPMHRQGQLGEEFREGHADVVEQMLVMIADENGIETGLQAYRYLPSEGWEWDEPKIVMEDENSGGAVPRVFTAFFMAQKMVEKYLERNEE